jgi:6-phosphofructokinase 1
VGVPKTIDNDILLMDRTFGFDTAVEEAQKAIHAAYTEVYLLR